MANILFVLGSYFPKPSANGICVSKVAKQLIEDGNTVSVLSNQLENKNDENLDGVNVYRVKSSFSDRIEKWCNENKNSSYLSLIKYINKIICKIKNLIFLPIWPFNSIGYCYRCYIKAKKLQKNNKYDFVISVYNPIDSIVCGALLKKKNPNIKWYIYFLDSLTFGVYPKYFSEIWAEKKGAQWEKWYMKYVDKIIIMKSHEKKYNNNRYDKYRKKIEVMDIPLLTNLNKSSNIINRDDQINFSYIGSIMKNLKNPEYLLKVFNAIENKNYNLNFYGTNDCQYLFEKFYKENRSCMIKQFGQVSHDKAIEAMYKSDILINIGSLVDQQIPCKIFEYMSTGKPIITFYKSKNEPSLVYLKKYPLALLINEDNEKINDNAKKIIEFTNRVLNSKVMFKDIEKIFSNNTPRAFSSLFKDFKGEIGNEKLF